MGAKAESGLEGWERASATAFSAPGNWLTVGEQGELPPLQQETEVTD